MIFLNSKYLVNNYDYFILLKIYDYLVNDEKRIRETSTHEDYLEYERIVSDFTFLLKRMNLC